MRSTRVRGRRRDAVQARLGAAEGALMPLLAVNNLHTYFKTREGEVRAVDGVSFAVDRGTMLGIVGESGCGKSVTMLSIMGLIELLQEVHIPNAASRLDDYPHRYSGGMRQRVMIAIAISCKPKLLIADEPTTALDVTVQAGVLDLLHELRTEYEMAVIIITHDM